jgi:hypothetical protein
MIGPALVLDSTLKSRVAFRTRSGKNALRWISNRALLFSEIILDGQVWDEDLSALLLEAVRHRPITPLRVAVPGASPALRSTFGALGCQLIPSAVDSRPPIEMQSGLASALSLQEEGEYLGIPVPEFLGVESTPYDVYFKSPLGKWVLLFRAGEPSLSERISSYWQKGLQVLYIRRQAQEYRLADIQAFSNRFSSDPVIPAKLKTAHLVRSVSRRLESLRKLEQVDSECWNSVARAVTEIGSTWTRESWGDSENVLWNATLLDHGSSVMVIALMLGRALGFETPALATRLGLAAAFHDIGLLGATVPLVQSFFESHASRGAEWVLHRLHADGLVGQAISLHHWRRNQRDAFGFSDGVPRMVEILGLAEELDAEIRKEAFAFDRGWLARFRGQVADQFSVPVLDGLEQTFGRVISGNEVEIDFGSPGDESR